MREARDFEVGLGHEPRPGVTEVANGQRVSITSDLVDGESSRFPLRPVGATRTRVEADAPAHIMNRYERFVKPVVDRVGAVAMLLLLSPLLAVIAFLIRVNMGSGVIFKQARVGKDERLFTVYKFRTMTPDRRRGGGPPPGGHERRRTHKSPRHPLVTPLGRLLRQFGVDELPQLWNVVLGDMSLVGPRPELPWIVERYEAWQHRRHVVKPGITGLWQVTTRGVGVMHDRTDVDLEYLDRISFRSDVWLMLKTIPVMIRRRGAF
jgi:lipopolysaccharide/colanic/teichoic acid biosynthesis glycosyltransferase